MKSAICFACIKNVRPPVVIELPFSCLVFSVIFHSYCRYSNRTPYLVAQMQSYHHHHDTAPTSIKGKEPATTNWSASSQPFPYQRRRPLEQPAFIRPQATLTTSRSLGTLDAPGCRRSNTWTSSTRDLGLLSERDEVDDREEFVDEYNRLEKKVMVSVQCPAVDELLTKNP